MAAATTTAIVGGALGAGQAISGIIGKNKYQKQLDNLVAPEYENPYADIGISTEGSDILREESQRTNASLVDAARGGGVRSVMGSIPRISAINNDINREARAYIDDQLIRRDYAAADYQTRLNNIEENRYLGEVAGLGQAIQANRQDIWSGARAFGGAAMYAGRNGQFGGNQNTGT